MIFSLSCCCSRMRSTAFETCPSKAFTKSWQSIPGPKKPEIARCDQVCREWAAVLRSERVSVFERQGKGCFQVISISFSYRTLIVIPFFFLRDEHRKKSKANVITYNTFISDIKTLPI